jgi:LDH2 family malate/lactate/ureidoglycolate dehydrogenase
VGHICAAISLEAFGSAEAFKASLDEYIDVLHAAPPAAGSKRIMVAGEPEAELTEQRLRAGVPLHPQVAQGLQALGDEFGLARLF